MKLTAAQVDLSYLADEDFDGYEVGSNLREDEFDSEVYRTSVSRKEIRSKGDRERGEVVLHAGKTCKQVRKY